MIEPLQRLLKRACDVDLVLVQGLLEECESEGSIRLPFCCFPAFAEAFRAVVGFHRGGRTALSCRRSADSSRTGRRSSPPPSNEPPGEGLARGTLARRVAKPYL